MRLSGSSPKASGSQNFSALPGNPGIADLAECVPIAATDIPSLAAFVAGEKIDLTVVGPEAPLCAGIVDIFQTCGLRIFGPNQRAARLEGSKVFTKQILLKYDVPTATAAIFNDADAARVHLRKVGAPIVVKADGLAAGKGVIVASSVEEAEQAVAEIMEKKVFGVAGGQVVIEECLRGEELSVMALVDGQSFCALSSAQDHKRALDGDRGPNTGGMGAYSPTPVVDKKLDARVADIFQRTLAGLQAEGIEYRGVLYRRLDDHRTRPASARVQLPFRRPGNPGRAATVGIRPGGCGGSDHRRLPGPPEAGLEVGRHCLRRDGGGRLSRRV